MRLPVQRLIAAALVFSAVVGCGSSKPTEPTVAQQVEVAQLERNPEIRARTLVDLSVKQRTMKDTPGAAATMTLALKSAQEIKDPATKAEVLLLVAKELSAGGGSKLQASAAVDSARVAVATISDRGEKTAAMIDLGVSVQQLGEHDAAVMALNHADTLLEGIAKPEDKVPLLVSQAAARAVTGDKSKTDAGLQTAANLTETITDARLRVRTQSNAAAILYRADQTAAGRKFYDAAAASARGIADPQGRAYALSEIFEALSAFRTRVPVNELLTEAGTAAQQVKDLDQQAILMRHLQSLLSSPK